MATLDDIRNAMNPATRDIELARKLAGDYIAEHPDQFARLRELSVEDCVHAATIFRTDGMDDEAWIIEAWLLHEHDPRNRRIVGGLNMPIDPQQIIG